MDIVAISLLSFALGAWSSWRWIAHTQLRAKRAGCNHRWGEPGSLYGQRRKDEWFRHCQLCGQQQNGETAAGPWK